ncbi:hypothetical protein M2324_003867 [Rhodovulum sulfidophilum]|uniref:hypothetical protein n=1 Tax=Rhodovulum sulfidophilum TaxID=35806 RepID=UPI0012DA3276|nr:hypothetical protein [Rhodovulum sulfidophilum]MCW2305442.1 hypothetical protein [Rhodovulum sulfidophilum]
MKHIFKVIFIFIISAIGGSVMANERDPIQTALGMDISLAGVKLDLRVNDVPISDPSFPLGSDGPFSTVMTLNSAFASGKNSVTLSVFPEAEASPGWDRHVHARFGYWPATDFPMPFDDRAFAIDVQYRFGADAPEGDFSVTYAGQEWLEASEVGTITSTDEQNMFGMSLEVGLDLPPLAWMQGQYLNPDVNMKHEILEQYAKLHSQVSGGFDGLTAALAPYFSRQAGAFGVSLEQFIELNVLPMFGPESGTEFLPLDTSKSELRIYGDGRLAALVPMPLTYRNGTYGEEGVLLIYFWKDQAGQWQIIH